MGIKLNNILVDGSINVTSIGQSDPYFSNVTLLAQFQGTNGSTVYTDSSSFNNTMAKHTGDTDNPVISTAQKVGTSVSSVYMNRAGAPPSIRVDNTNGAFFFPGDFTIEAWTYLSASNIGYPTILRMATPTGGYWLFRVNGTDYEFAGPSFGLGTSGGLAAANVGQWAHIAAVRAGSTMSLYVNGVSRASQQNSNAVGAANTTVGSACISWPSPGESWDGYLSDVRITKGVARYTANFTPEQPLFATY